MPIRLYSTSVAKAHYGIDAPTVLRNLILGAIACFLLSLFVMRGFIGPAIGLSIAALMMLWGSLVGKFRARDKLLAAIPWRGDEQVLDVGCGHGLMLIGAAKRLNGGRATGIDIWQSVDQAGNSAEATRSNAEAEGVDVDIRDGDARKIPFGDETFDVVLSSLALHNIYDKGEREQALREIARVTKRGGHIGIVDIRHAYAPVFEQLGCTITRKWWSPMFAMSTRGMVARKG